MERRGRPKIELPVDTPSKFTRIYEDEQAIEIWIYDLDKFTRGPIHTEIKWKKGYPLPPIKRKRKTKKEMQNIDITNTIKPIKNAKKNKNTRRRYSIPS